MKRKSQIQRWLFAATVGLIVSWSTIVTSAATYTNILVQAFNDALSPAVISALYGNTATVYDWSTDDADSSASSGSLMVTVSWIETNAWQETQLNYSNPTPWPGLAVPPYSTIDFDVKVMSGNIGTNGTYGGVQFVAQGFDGNGANGTPTAANWFPLGLVPITSTGWTHVSQGIESFQPYNLNQIVINFVAQGADGVTNTVTYLVDNIEITAATNPPPTLSLGAPPVSGLHLVTPSTGNEFQRQNIRTVGTNFMWHGAGSPVTYSVTIGKYPTGPTFTNFETHIFLVPNQTPFTPDPDWSGRSVVRLDIGNSNNAGGFATFRYKTNSPSNNGGYYGTNQSTSGPQYAPVPAPSVVGTWTLTFNQNTNVTITAPNGNFSNYVINTEAAAWFNTNNLRVYFGAQANNTNNMGQEVIVTGASVTGAPGSISDDFLGSTLDTNKWQKAAQVPANVYQVLGAAFTVNWFTPDNLFSFSVATNLAQSSPWQTSALLSSYTGGKRTVAIPKGYPGPSQGYFALVKRNAVKLLVLLPGETYAPGTAAGKTGTPIAQTNGVGFQAVVKAVDAKNYQAFSTDTIWVETPGDTNTLSFAYVPQLVLGSYSFNVTNSTAGSWTIRAADSTDTNITEYVTGPYTVN